MNELSIELEKLRDHPLSFHYAYPAEGLVTETEPDLRFPGEVTGDVTFTRVGAEVLANGELRAEAHGPCARCLADATQPLVARVEEVWAKPAGDEHAHVAREDEDFEPDLTHPLVGDRIELSEIFRELLLAELPPRLLCRDDCRGLCPVCGADLNREPCDCAQDGQDAALQPEWKRRLRGLHLDE